MLVVPASVRRAFLLPTAQARETANGTQQQTHAPHGPVKVPQKLLGGSTSWP